MAAISTAALNMTVAAKAGVAILIDAVARWDIPPEELNESQKVKTFYAKTGGDVLETHRHGQ